MVYDVDCFQFHRVLIVVVLLTRYSCFGDDLGVFVVVVRRVFDEVVLPVFVLQLLPVFRVLLPVFMVLLPAE